MRSQILIVTNIQWLLFFPRYSSTKAKKKCIFKKKDVERVYNLIFQKFDFENNRKWLQGTDPLPQG